MKSMLYTTVLSGLLAFGISGTPLAQSANPGSTSQPGAAQAPNVTTPLPGTQQQGARPGTAAQDMRMSESQIKSGLSARGYSDIGGMQMDGSTFKVGEAKRYGETVKDLRVDARTGAVQNEQRLSENQAKQLLRDRNYSEVSDVKRDGDIIRAKAKQGDQTYNLRIDARSGTVTQQSASN